MNRRDFTKIFFLGLSYKSLFAYDKYNYYIVDQDLCMGLNCNNGLPSCFLVCPVECITFWNAEDNEAEIYSKFMSCLWCVFT